MFSNCRWLNFGCVGEWSHVGEMWAKYTLKSNDPWLKVDISTKESQYQLLRPKYPAPIELSAIKMNTLHDYCRYLPERYHRFYPAPEESRLAMEKAAQTKKTNARRSSTLPV